MRFSRLGYWGPSVAAIGLVLLILPLIHLAFPGGPTPAKAIAAGVLAAVDIVIALFSYRSADEIIMGTHKTAWFWDSMAACCVLAPLTIVMSSRLIPVPMLLPRHQIGPGDYFVEGMLCVLLLEVAGFFAVMTYHQIRRARS